MSCGFAALAGHQRRLLHNKNELLTESIVEIVEPCSIAKSLFGILAEGSALAR
jgi:hypothetical protein